ncbi:hypothetical protein NQ317_000987 [Molorchus minor]|uniref:Uncharacterized protein n=1 Tax=Molorchus minor TaxID=1323400 RepID=A0ABQ9JQP9_9CUCU|nr:hypothetical protein NQ317_000987 [Molorchus minor]
MATVTGPAMEKPLKALSIHRTSFLRIYEETIKLMESGNGDLADIEGNVRVLSQKMEVIQDLDRQMLSLMLENDVPEEDVEAEVARADDLVGKYNRLKSKFERSLNVTPLSDTESSSSSSLSKRQIKLPKIELKKFSGEITEWLPFWAQFSRIHKDEHIANEDKFQYLIQSTVSKSRARLLVESYPQTSENYLKAIESLKSRFGREDLLIEVYVRELLKLVLNNFNSKINLSLLYDQIESKLRSLETLGVNTDKCAAMLYPLVESCLPEDLLRVWQRSRNYDIADSLKLRLEGLIEFFAKRGRKRGKGFLSKDRIWFRR